MDSVTFALMMQAADAGATMTAGQFTSPTTGRGFLSAAYSAHIGGYYPAIGAVSDDVTAFGVVGSLAYFPGLPGSAVVLSAPSGTPATITIDGIAYSLSYSSDDGVYFVYDIAGFAGFANGVTYNWVLS